MAPLDFYLTQPWVFPALAGVLGLLVGSFLNVVIHRLPIMLERQWRSQCREVLGGTDESPAEKRFNLVLPRSRCPQCGHQVTALENIPVLSYLFLRGKCSECGSRISLRYPVVELLAATAAVTVAWHFGPTWQAAALLGLSWSLLALSFIDLQHQLLPDNITLPLVWSGLLLSLIPLFADTSASIVGATAGYLALWLVYWAFKLATRKEGMGYGDFKLLAALGAWLGWQMLPVIILLASLVGSLVGITMMLFAGHRREVPIPFGPYLAAAGWVAALWGPDLVQAYLSWHW